MSFVDHVFSSGENFALLRPATQSSMWEDYVASKAVDGNAVDDSSCAITNTGDYKPWWKVQLAYPISVTHVELTNRQPSGGVCRSRWVVQWNLFVTTTSIIKSMTCDLFNNVI